MDPVGKKASGFSFDSLTSIKNIAKMYGGRIWQSIFGGNLAHRVSKIYASIQNAPKAENKGRIARWLAKKEMQVAQGSWKIAQLKIAKKIRAVLGANDSDTQFESTAVFFSDIKKNKVVLDRIREIETKVVQNINGSQLNPVEYEYRQVGGNVVSNVPAMSHKLSSQDAADIIDGEDFALLFDADGVSGSGKQVKNSENIGASGALSALLKKAVEAKIQDRQYRELFTQITEDGDASNEIDAFFQPLISEMVKSSESIPFLGNMKQEGSVSYEDKNGVSYQEDSPNVEIGSSGESTTCTLTYIDKTTNKIHGVLLGDSSVFVLSMTKGEISSKQFIGAETGSMSIVGGYLKVGLPGQTDQWKIENQGSFRPQKFSADLSEGALVLSVTDGLTDNIVNPKCLEHIILGEGFDKIPTEEVQDNERANPQGQKRDEVRLPNESAVERAAGKKSATLPSTAVAERRIRNYMEWLCKHEELRKTTDPAANYRYVKDDDLAMAIYKHKNNNLPKTN